LYAKNRQYDDKQVAEAEYEKGLTKMVKALWNRVQLVATDEMPDLSIYE
jgi:hypothetical protein